MNWFEEWFDSPLYEKLYQDRDESEAQQLIRLLEKDLALKKKAKILDVGCGRGRHAINLAQKGYKVTGIDLSEQAISTAKVKAQTAELDNVRFEVRDMRNPMPETFDAIFNLFTTFGYFMDDEENKKVLESIVKMLAPKGIFVLDFLNANKVRSSFKPKDSGTFQDIDYYIKRYIKDDAIHKDIHFKRETDGAQRTYSERVKLYELDWFKKEMSALNLMIDEVYGNYKGSNFDPQESPRLLIISHLQK